MSKQIRSKCLIAGLCRKRNLARLLTRSLLLLILGGCTSSQVLVPQFYTLQSRGTAEEAVQGSVEMETVKLRIMEVTTADYLSQAGIVMADGEGTIHSANYHRWAEQPAVAIKRRLEHCALSDAANRKRQSIDLEVHRFQGDGGGGVVFAGVWSATPHGDRIATGTYLFEYREKQRGDGYGPLVKALSLTVQKLCDDILANTR